jgi:hypothetical protein
MGYGGRKKDMVTEESVQQAVVTTDRKFYFIITYMGKNLPILNKLGLSVKS